MADKVPQSFENYVRYDPLFHFFIIPVFIITFVGTAIVAVRHPHLHSIWAVVVSAAVVALAFRARMYALKVQDRVIRLEERLRLATLLGEPLRARISELTESQLIALRFASDAEIPSLVEQTLANRMESKEIKKAVKNWRADEWRV